MTNPAAALLPSTEPTIMNFNDPAVKKIREAHRSAKSGGCLRAWPIAKAGRCSSPLGSAPPPGHALSWWLLPIRCNSSSVSSKLGGAEGADLVE
jgi:hypothetical protein